MSGLIQFTQCTWYIILKARNLYSSGFLNGGGGGIRTHGTLARTTVFKTAPINRSGTPPKCIFGSPIYNNQNISYCKEFFIPEFLLYNYLRGDLCLTI